MKKIMADGRISWVRIAVLTAAAGMILACGLPLSNQPPAPTQAASLPTATQTPAPTRTPFEVSVLSATVTQIPSVTPTGTPAGVVLQSPPDGSDLPASGLMTFDWQPFPGASTYRIDFTNPKGTMISFNENSTRHERYAESLPWDGDFTWQVVALDSRSRVVGSSAVWRFYKPAASGGDDGGGDGGDDDDDDDDNDRIP